jgi:hypothetical protein
MESPNPFSSPRDALPAGAVASQFRISPLACFCVAYYLLAITWGVHATVATAQSAGDLVLSVALALCLGIWATVDARQRQRPIPRSQHLWFFVLALFVVPGYVIGSRGWKGLGWVVFHIVGWVMISTVAMNATAFVR